MQSLGLFVKLLMLVALILNGTAVHGVQLIADRITDPSHGSGSVPNCHSAGERLDSSHGQQQNRSETPAGKDAPAHDCGGAGCQCACLYHTPPLALAGITLGLLSGAPSMPATPRIGFHSLTPLPLLRPPIA